MVAKDLFAILGVNLFGGKFYKCDDLEVFGRHDCVGTYTYEAECPEPHSYPNDGKKCVYMGAPSWRIAYGGGPSDHGFSFDDISSALQTLFLVGTCAGWSECLYLSMDTVGVDMQPQRLANPAGLLMLGCYAVIAASLSMGSVSRKKRKRQLEKTIACEVVQYSLPIAF